MGFVLISFNDVDMLMLGSEREYFHCIQQETHERDMKFSSFQIYNTVSDEI